MAKKQNQKNAEVNEIAVTQSNEIAVTPTFDRRGFEEMDMDSIVMPIAKLLQSNSPEVTDESFADYGFRAGKVIHSLLLEEMPDEFIPIKIFDDKVLFVPRNDAEKQSLKEKVQAKFGITLTDDDLNGMLLCRAKDNKCGDRFGECSSCGLCEFDGNDKPVCGKNINVLALFKGQEMPVVIRFTNTSHKHGRQFKSIAYYNPGALFSRKYKLVTTKKSADGKMWYELSVRPAGKTEGDDLLKAESLFNQFIKMDIRTEEAPTAEQTEVETEF